VRVLRDRLSCRAVVITDGKRGCVVATEDDWFDAPPPKVKCRDATGAGDAFLGGVLFGLARDLRWTAIAALANACGAACCERLGAFPDPAASRQRVEDLRTRAP